MIRNTSRLLKLLGINNKLGDRELEIFREGRPAGRFLRNAVNVDITNNGTLKRRAGYTRVKALASTTKIWADEDDCFVVAAKTLYRFDGVTTTQMTSLQSPEPIFCRTPVGVVVGDGVTLYRVSGLTLIPLVPPTPSPVPDVVSGAGALQEGRYVVTFASQSTTDGALSGCTTPQYIALSDSAALVISMSASAHNTLVYVSHPNGEVPYLRGLIPAGGTSYVHSSDDSPLAPAATMFMSPLNPTSYMTTHGGRLWGASGATMRYSAPFKYGLSGDTDYITMPGEITGLGSLGEYLFVGTDRGLFRLSGYEPSAMGLELMSSARVIPGSFSKSPLDQQMYAAQSGGSVMSFRSNGEVSALDEAVTLPTAQSAVASEIRRDGVDQYILQLQRPGENLASASSYMEADVIRRGMLSKSVSHGE